MNKLHEHHIEAKSLLRQYKKIDPYFASCYGMNIYRGCSHGCIYCDGRHEKYNVCGNFDSDIGVKTNAPALLDAELSRKKKRNSLAASFIMLGGGVGDVYQHSETSCRLTRSILQVLLSHSLPVHILTKSDRILEDADLIADIHSAATALVSCSLSSSDEKISRFLEPGASSPARRLNALEKLSARGICTGVFLMPVVPRITDSTKMMKQSLMDCKNAGVSFVTFGPMTLKAGRQMDYFLSKIEERDHDTAQFYRKIYGHSAYGNPDSLYYEGLVKAYDRVHSETNIARFIPHHIFSRVLAEKDSMAIMLDQMSVIEQSRGKWSELYKAANAVRSLDDLSLERVQTIPGLKNETFSIIRELLQGNFSSYTKLIYS